MLETNRMQSEDPGEKVFCGLPITSISVIMPLIFLLEFLMSEKLFTIVLIAMLIVVGTCFILNFKLKKPSNLVLGILIAVVTAAVVVIVLFSQFNIIR